MIDSIMVAEKRGIESNDGRPRSGSIALAWLWLVGFTIWFHSFGLVNNENVPRRYLWGAVPFDLMDLIDPPVDSSAPAWGFVYLFQRIPFFLIAVFIWLSAWAIGSQILRRLSLKLAGAEQIYFATSLGLSALSLVMLLLGVCGWMSQPLLVVILIGCIAFEIIERSRSRQSTADRAIYPPSHQITKNRLLLGWFVLLMIVPFFVGQQLGAMTPQNDFDVAEYHLGGPKEWFQKGRIERLPHNVYTSFPFLTEMLLLTGMVVYGDWQWGALAGQSVIAGFAPLTAIGLFAAGRRFFSREVGWIAALVYMTSPWTYRISIIAYVEGGLACYLFASLYAMLLYRHLIKSSEGLEGVNPTGIAAVTGILSGSAMACKYTGLVSVAGPIGLLLAGTAWVQAKNKIARQIVATAIPFVIGFAISIGPWLLKNTFETGNPVYPLAVRVFGGIDRDPQLDAKFRKGHASRYQSIEEAIRKLPFELTNIMTQNDWHSPLMFGLAPLSFLTWWQRRKSVSDGSIPREQDPRVISLIWLYVAWQFISYWYLTHLIDRFYVPMFSAVALLAGVGAVWYQSIASKWSSTIGGKIWNVALAALCLASVFYNFEVMRWVGGFNAGRIDLTAARDQITIGRSFPRIGWINEQVESGQFPANTKVLCVGEAALFHARFPYLYNTVFDHSLFEKLCADPNSPAQLKSAEEIRSEFRRLGITHIDVNWAEILRYRDPASYGYTDFVHPNRFVELQKMGILGSQILPPQYSLSRLTSDSQRDRIAEWAPGLILPRGGGQDDNYYISAQLFPVQNAEH